MCLGFRCRSLIAIASLSHCGCKPLSLQVQVPSNKNRKTQHKFKANKRRVCHSRRPCPPSAVSRLSMPPPQAHATVLFITAEMQCFYSAPSLADRLLYANIFLEMNRSHVYGS